MATMAAKAARSIPASLQIPTPKPIALGYKPITGVVVSAGKMDKTIKVRIARQLFNKRIKKNYVEYENFLVSDPSTSCLTGDIVSILPKGYRSSPQVRHIVHSIIAPMGPPISERPPIPSLQEFEVTRQAKRLHVLQKQVEAGVEKAVVELQQMKQRAKRVAAANAPPSTAPRHPYAGYEVNQMKPGDWLCGASSCAEQNWGSSADGAKSDTCRNCGTPKSEAAFVVGETGLNRSQARAKIIEVAEASKPEWIATRIQEKIPVAQARQDADAVASLLAYEGATPKMRENIRNYAAVDTSGLSFVAASASSTVAGASKTDTESTSRQGPPVTESKQNETGGWDPASDLNQRSLANKRGELDEIQKGLKNEEELEGVKEQVATELNARDQQHVPREKIEEVSGGIEAVTKEPLNAQSQSASTEAAEPLVQGEPLDQAAVSERIELQRELKDDPDKEHSSASSKGKASNEGEKKSGWLSGMFGR